MICCYVLFLAWFCSYDFDGVSLIILIWVKFVFLMGQKFGLCFFWVFLWCVCVFFSYINKYIYIHIHIYIVWKHIKIISHQHRLKIAPKPYQNHIKIIWKHIKTTNTNHIKIKSKSHQHRIKTVSKPYQNHIQSISKPYLNHNPNHIKSSINHIEIITPNSKRIKFIS